MAFSETLLADLSLSAYLYSGVNPGYIWALESREEFSGK